MLSKCYSYGINGLDAYPVTIEVDVSKGLPALTIVGLPDNAVKESKERVRAAIKNCGYKFPRDRITINLSPADTKKEGPAHDLAIAMGILAASDQIPIEILSQYIFLGELSLDGNIQPIKGMLPITSSLRSSPFSGIIIPKGNAVEASIPKTIKVFPVNHLYETIQFITDELSINAFSSNQINKKNTLHSIDFNDVKGQAHVKRGLEIAASGGHNALLIGPPGSGKSMLAKRLPTILPDMNDEEALETTKIHSIMGYIKPGQGLISSRPFRSPHHTTSHIAIVGGGGKPRPGEATLSHNGILFLDELPEFNRNVLESLRQPLEDHYVTISRARQTVRYPSRFMLIAAMNPCPCGRLHKQVDSSLQ